MSAVQEETVTLDELVGEVREPHHILNIWENKYLCEGGKIHNPDVGRPPSGPVCGVCIKKYIELFGRSPL